MIEKYLMQAIVNAVGGGLLAIIIIGLLYFLIRREWKRLEEKIDAIADAKDMAFANRNNINLMKKDNLIQANQISDAIRDDIDGALEKANKETIKDIKIAINEHEKDCLLRK